MYKRQVEGAAHYLLEFARDGSFSKILKSKVVKGTELPFPQDLGCGTFYWRVTAVSSDGLPGLHSKVRFFLVMRDDTPPFLALRTPKEGTITSENFVILSGNTEKDVILTIQDEPVQVDAEGDFQFRYPLLDGENKIIIKATDQSGNVTKVVRTVRRVSKFSIELTFGSNLYQVERNYFLVGNRSFSLIGKTIPNGVITVSKIVDRYYNTDEKTIVTEAILSKPHLVVAKTIADENGYFNINLEMAGEKDGFAVEVASSTGEIRLEEFVVELDSEPPIIDFTQEIPVATKDNKLLIAGMISGGVSLELNEEKVPLKDVQGSTLKTFQLPVILEPGMNRLHFEAYDQVGNIAVLEKKVNFDPDAPEYVNHELSLQKAKGGEEAYVLVRAKDATGLVKVAPFTVQIGKQSLSGYMILSDSKGTYSGMFRIPKNIRGEIRLKKVTLSDYLGNRKEYCFN